MKIPKMGNANSPKTKKITKNIAKYQRTIVCNKDGNLPMNFELEESLPLVG